MACRLAVSLVTGQAFRMERIRAKRPKPGLLKQHAPDYDLERMSYWLRRMAERQRDFLGFKG